MQRPIDISSLPNRDVVSKEIDQILAAKKQDPNTDTSALEREIDELVYKLYGLTEEEIQIIENKKDSSF